jgi:hypothetical protein
VSPGNIREPPFDVSETISEFPFRFNHHHHLIKSAEQSPFIRILFVLGSETEGEQTAKE